MTAADMAVAMIDNFEADSFDAEYERVRFIETPLFIGMFKNRETHG